MRISLQVCTKDRHGELGILLQSLRTQTFKNWDLTILDQSGSPIANCEFLVKLINRIKMENHCVNMVHDVNIFGVCDARNKLIKLDYFNNELVGRIDDDVFLEQDYLKKLVNVLKQGYDIASGVTPIAFQPLIKRDLKFVGKKINEKIVDKTGNITKFGDDCGTGFLQDDVLPTDEFRSCALMKRKVIDKINYPNNLSPVGFREEGFFSTKAINEGFTIGVCTSAIAWHFASASGGVRYPDYPLKVQSDDVYFKKWYKKQWKLKQAITK